MTGAGEQIGSLLTLDITLAVTLVSIFAGSLISGLAGFAFSAISGALLLHWLAPAEAVPLLLGCSIMAQVFSLMQLRHTLQWRRCMPFLLGGLVGIPVGTQLLLGVDPHAFAAGFGIFLVGYSGYALLRPSLVIQRGGRLVDMATGFAGGITGGAIAFPGAIPTAWCTLRGLSKQDQRGVVQPFILLMQIATLAYLSKFGVLSSGSLATYLWCAPVVVIGTWLGLRLCQRIDDAMFRRVVLIALLASGAILAAKTGMA